ncbi:MAG: glycosyltransferase family 9 protein [Bdellovibrionales bacterium]
MAKILIIRFSSFGDVLQCLSVAGALRARWPEAEIHWVTRQEFIPLIETHPAIHKVWGLSREKGARGLSHLANDLRSQKFTHVYDAHNNLRSRLLGWKLKGVADWRVWLGQMKFLRRSIYRWRRFLLFRFHRNLFPQPFNGQADLLRPLKTWGIPLNAPSVPQLFLTNLAQSKAHEKLGEWAGKPFVALAPSAAFLLKRWPLAHWQNLIESQGDLRFVILGGPQDQFVSELVKSGPDRVLNLAGQLSLSESAAVIQMAQALVSNDTGLLHVAEQLGKPCLALMGPAPFGFPSRPLTKIIELPLPCRPCSKHGQGPCVNPNYHQCLVGISPELVAEELRLRLGVTRVAP